MPHLELVVADVGHGVAHAGRFADEALEQAESSALPVTSASLGATGPQLGARDRGDVPWQVLPAGAVPLQAEDMSATVGVDGRPQVTPQDTTSEGV